MNRVLLILISFFIAFEIKSIEDLVGRNLICRGKYQIIGYEFLTQNKVIRHASSVSESDYYKNSGLYALTPKFVSLDVDGDIFVRKILRKSLELFIGEHFENSKEGECNFYLGNLSKYFNTLNVR